MLMEKELRKISFEGMFLYVNELQEALQWFKKEIIRHKKNR